MNERWGEYVEASNAQILYEIELHRRDNENKISKKSS